MEHPLYTRLAAEALGTFLFFFLGFSGIAVVVDIGADAITPIGVAAGFGFGLALAATSTRRSAPVSPSAGGSPPATSSPTGSRSSWAASGPSS